MNNIIPADTGWIIRYSDGRKYRIIAWAHEGSRLIPYAEEENGKVPMRYSNDHLAEFNAKIVYESTATHRMF